MATSDDDNNVDGNGTTSNKVDDDSNVATGNEDSNGDDDGDGDNDGDGDGVMGSGAMGYDEDDDGRTIAAKCHHAVGRRCPMPPPNDYAPLPCPDTLLKQHCTPKMIGMMCV